MKKQFRSKKFKNFKHSIGDGFLMVWENPTTPTLYITEVELERHDINRHILPQLGNFISFVQSSGIEELNEVRNYLYEEIKKEREVFNGIREYTQKEVYKLLDNALEDLQILLVIDRVSADLSIGLSQIEKAINVRIRKIEVSRFISSRNKEVIFFTDSEDMEVINTFSKIKKSEQYSEEYHLENKPEKIQNIVREFVEYVRKKSVRISPMKFYIGFYKNNTMIFSCVVRKSSVIFYSKVSLEKLKSDKLAMRDVRKIGHYTNHLPTEIVITEPEQIKDLMEYFDEVYRRY